MTVIVLFLNQRKTHVYEEVPGRHVTIGSMVECGGNPTHYGVIKWIGCLPGSTATVAGVELVSLIFLSIALTFCLLHYPMYVWMNDDK